jgi:hypothetical protein
MEESTVYFVVYIMYEYAQKNIVRIVQVAQLSCAM